MKLKKRALKQEFLNKFKEGGEYAEITDLVKKDNSLILCLRGDNVCIYYKCLRILKINQNGKFELDKNYSKDEKKILDPNNYIRKWPQYFKDAKELLDNYTIKGDQLEKAVQQALVTENNYSKVCNDTDYFTIDVEYEQKGSGRFDALAVHWPKNKRKSPKNLQLAFIEVKDRIHASKSDVKIKSASEASNQSRMPRRFAIRARRSIFVSFMSCLSSACSGVSSSVTMMGSSQDFRKSSVKRPQVPLQTSKF